MIRLIHGDSRTALEGLADASVDALVTDPPAGISFMGKQWDDFRRAANPADAGRDSVFGRTSARGPEFGRADMREFIDQIAPVFRACLRVLKPGAHGLVWAIPRTSHWTATALEEAGFELREKVFHLHGQGFPKSHSVAKALGDPAFDGLGTALKPAVEEWLLVRKPLDGTIAENVLAHGTGALNIGACRIPAAGGSPSIQRRAGTAPLTATGSGWHNGGSAEAYRAPHHGEDVGRWPANLVLSHDESCVESAGACVPTCPIRQLDDQAGVRKSGKGAVRQATAKGHQGNTYGATSQLAGTPQVTHADSGPVSRFFYCPKTNRRDRGEGNDHPTVKNQELMRWLVTLITPPGGTVLDPFMGSGSTGLAAVAEGCDFIGAEREEQYLEIALRRLSEQ